MIINTANLRILNTAFKAQFQAGLEGVPSAWKKFATEIPSSTSEELYPWMKQIPGMREWIGARVVKNVGVESYKLRNRKWEDTIAVKADAVKDDTYGTYSPLMKMLGDATGRQPDELVSATILGGFASNCYDGQFFFDTDHPVTNADGSEVSVSNMQAGGAAPWFLLDLSKALKPFIFQNREKAKFVTKDSPDDHRVFEYDEFTYGSSARNAAGYGFWQTAFGSKAALTPANFLAGFDAMATMKGDQGRKLGIKATHLLCGTSNRAAAEAIVKKMNLVGGESNLDYGRVELEVSSWLD